MAWEPHVDADHFLIAVFKARKGQEKDADAIISGLEREIRAVNGKIHLRSGRRASWDIMDGQDNFVEPNHLNPAVFNFDHILIAGFKTSETVHTWWNSDEVFELMKFREAVEKMGLFTVDGLVEAYDVNGKTKLSFGDKLMLLEFLKLESFKPMQRYVDQYKRFSTTAQKDAGVQCNLTFAEGISGVLMNEFPVEAVCGSTWRTRSDLISWYESPNYQKVLMPLRYDHARCFAVVVPMFEDKLDTYKKAQSTTAGTKLKGLQLK